VTYQQILLEKRGSVGLITLNRPERLNAWTSTMQAELRDAVSACHLDPAIGALVFTGAGRAYCAGADIGGWAQELQAGGTRQGSGATIPGDDWVQFLRKHPKPTVAALNGVAVGVGITHVLPMDIRIASENARFGMFFIKMGLVPELASSHFLAQLVGTGRALEWCLTARMIDAGEACRAGLVSEVVPADALLDRALSLAEHLAAQPPSAVAAIKALFEANATDGDIAAVMHREMAALEEARRSPDHHEAVAAFMEKRQPRFSRG
jgi:2-(1,2-epoxy-1,2-dihydrophenyl)acetyl-CoA isomerase